MAKIAKFNESQISKPKTQNHNSNLKSNLRYRTYHFSLNIIKFIQPLPGKKIYWIFIDQILRAVISIGANLIEAKESSSKKDFIKFYEIALKSANETIYWLCLIRDSKLVEGDKIRNLLQEATEIANMTASSPLTLKGRKF